MAFVVKHALRATASFVGGFRPEGWHPALKVTLLGPTPGGAQVVWTVRKPDGSAWFEHAVDCPELDDTSMATVDLQTFEDGIDIDEAGVVPFTVRVVSELDGIDELLHDGALTAVALDGDHRYAIDHDWLLPTAFVGLDVQGESDGPRLRVTTFLKGEVDSYQCEAHCFYEGKRFAQATDVSSRTTLTANDGATVGQEIVAEFDTVRGWNNLTDQGWGGDDWHVLDAHDGEYQVKVLREKKVTRIVSFTVKGGQIVATGLIEPDEWAGVVTVAGASIEGAADGDHAGTADAFYGDADLAAVGWGALEMYALRRVPDAPAPDALDDETAENLQAYIDRVERLFQTWEQDMIGGPGVYSGTAMDFGLQCEAVIREVPGFNEKYDALPTLTDAHPIVVLGEPSTIGAARDRVAAMAALAQGHLTGSATAAEDALARYRAVLANDKLAVFEDHPAPDFLYYTTNKKVIETPEQLAAAEFWYFEGVSEARGTGTVDGSSVDVTVQGWRVLGWKFAADGTTVDEWEDQGNGSSAPKSAFKHA